MIHFSTTFVVHLLTCCCQISYTSVVLETSFLLPPPSTIFQNISTSLPSHSQDFHHNAGSLFLKQKMLSQLHPTSQTYTVLKPPSSTQWHINSPWKIINKNTPKTSTLFSKFHTTSQEEKENELS